MATRRDLTLTFPPDELYEEGLLPSGKPSKKKFVHDCKAYKLTEAEYEKDLGGLTVVYNTNIRTRLQQIWKWVRELWTQAAMRNNMHRSNAIRVCREMEMKARAAMEKYKLNVEGRFTLQEHWSEFLFVFLFFC